MDCLASRADQLTAFIYFVKHEAASLLGSTPMMSNSSFKPTLLRGGLIRCVKENLMAIRIFAILFSTFVFGTFAHAQEGMRERSDWRKFFSEFQAKGTIVVADERQTDRVILVFDQVRSRNATRRPRHSRFHIHFLHLTQALHVMSFKFSDGTASKEALQLTTKTKTLRSAMRNSTVWIYELFAKEIGEDKARRYLKQIDYGNADPSTSNGD